MTSPCEYDPLYTCSSCGKCYCHHHTPIYIREHGPRGQWYWEGPCGLKYAYMEDSRRPNNGQVIIRRGSKKWHEVYSLLRNK